MASSFLAGFAEGATRAIEEKRSFIRDTVERRREELRQQGYDRLNQTRQMRQGFQQAADILLSAGMTQENVVALLEDNPNMFATVAASVGQLAMAGEPPQNINGLVRIAANSRPSGVTLAEAINNAAPGIIRANEGVTDPVRRERNSIAAMLGLSTEDALQRNVYGEELVQGFTGADIAASTNADLVAPSRGQIQLDYSVLRQPEQLDDRSIRGFIDDLATGYSNDLNRDIARLNDLTGQAAGYDAMTEEKKQAFLTQASPYLGEFDPANPPSPEDIVTSLQEGIIAREQALEEPSAFLVQRAIEDFGMSPDRLLRQVELAPSILSPLYFESPFVDRFSGTQGIVTPEVTTTPLNEEGQTEEVFSPAAAGAAIETAEQTAGIITQALPALEQLPPDFREQVYLEGAGGVFPTPAFQTWLQENSSEEELLTNPEGTARKFFVETGVVPLQDILLKEFEEFVGDINSEEGAQKIISSSNFAGFVDFLKENLGRDITRSEAFEILAERVSQSPLGGNPVFFVENFVQDQDLVSKYFNEDENEFITLYEAIQ